MKNIIIVGSGPVGSFMAVLCKHLGFQVTVYEKREEFTRNINLKLDSNFFNEVHEVLSRLNIRNDFFSKLNENLLNRRNRILIRELEGIFAEEAKLLGAKYITREINSLDELLKEHKDSNPIVLDCAGRNSKLRIAEFGQDEQNIVTIPLQHAMYINFKAKMVDGISLYQVMKCVSSIKLSDVVVSKVKDSKGFSSITLPVFITKKLAAVFDEEYPNINRNPLNPFNSPDYVPDSISYPISSLIASLIVDGCKVDLNTVEVKKIEITCGYAKRRSQINLICLGDSAIHLAFFRSLNLGLRHALELFMKLSIHHNEAGIRPLKEEEIINKFIAHNPHLNPVRVYPTVAMNVFLVVTKIIWYGCFSFCLTDNKMQRLTHYMGVYESEIVNILYELNKKLSQWSNSLADFEKKRDDDIKYEVHTNQTKSIIYDSLSWFVDINGQSFIKISELTRELKGKYSLFSNDFEFFHRCFKSRKDALVTSDAFANTVQYLINQSKNAMFDPLRKICADRKLTEISKRNLICITVYRQHHNRNLAKSKTKIKTLPKLFSSMDVRTKFILDLIECEISLRFLESKDLPFKPVLHKEENVQPTASSSFM